MSTPSLSVSGSPESPPIDKRPARGLLLFAVTIFLSAFLLFQIQPLIAKIILPWFGGSAAVWTTCMLFFQIALLAGYSYAHWLTRKFSARAQGAIHTALLCASLALLPVLPSEWWKPGGGEDPLWRILGLLAATIGLPYFLLASTSPLLQDWFSRTHGGEMPYRFFALSNAGSMLGLLTYPVLVEPKLTGREQAWVWSGTYVVFLAFCAWTAFQSRRGERLTHRAAATAPALSLRLLWLALAASASALLLAVTNEMSQNVAAIPFLWILPLSLYLLSFILCFDSPRWYRRVVWIRFFAVAIGSLAYATAGETTISEIRVAIPLISTCLFICCMICHGELARLKPAPEHLTTFYLMTALGGALGGLFVAFFAPRVFNALYELPVAISACGLLVLYLFYRERPYGVSWKSAYAATLAVALVLFCALIGYEIRETRDHVSGARLLVRNFYGALRVTEEEGTAEKTATRQLTHGTINHGEEFRDFPMRRIPTTYYGRNTGIGLTLTELQKQSGPMNVGMIGLGAGTITAYGRFGDSYRIYEINPEVLRIARREFFYLQDCRAKVDVVLGDARLSLEREPSQQFDALAVDAFSSDSIPVHLLTREAFAVYWRHLRPNGVLAVHISNKYLDLEPVVQQLAGAFHKTARVIDNEKDDDTDTFSSTWVLVADRPGFFDSKLISKAATAPESKKIRMWTDDYSNLFQILK